MNAIRPGDRLDLGEPPTDPGPGQRALGDHHATARVGQGRHRSPGEQQLEHLVRRPAHRRHRDAEALVDHRALGRRCAPRRARRRRSPRATRAERMFELSPLETAANAYASSILAAFNVSRSNPDSGDGHALERAAQAAERGGLRVDDGDVVTPLAEALGQGRPDTAATHDHEVHATRRYYGGPFRARVPVRHTVAAWRTSVAFSSASSSAGPEATDWVTRFLEAAGPADLRQRRTLLRSRTHPTRSSSCWAWPAARRRHPLLAGRPRCRLRHGRRGRVVPAERPRLPERRRRLRGGDGQPRPQGRSHRGQRPARRLRPHRRRLRLVGCAERRDGHPVAARPRGAGRDRAGRLPHRDEPARGARVRQAFASSGVCVHPRHRGDGRRRRRPGGDGELGPGGERAVRLIPEPEHEAMVGIATAHLLLRAFPRAARR